eukprot:SAG22_NODE_3033_length_2010_cov_1.672423_4_plen_95_part_00
MVGKTLEYVEQFRKYNNTQALEGIREKLDTKGLSQYELGALANLCLDSVEEAKCVRRRPQSAPHSPQMLLRSLRFFVFFSLTAAEHLSHWFAGP